MQCIRVSIMELCVCEMKWDFMCFFLYQIATKWSSHLHLLQIPSNLSVCIELCSNLAVPYDLLLPMVSPVIINMLSSEYEVL